MPPAALNPKHPAIQTYHAMLSEAEGQDALHEGNVRRAFETLLRETARDLKSWELVTEATERREANAVRYDGTLRDGNRLPHGWWEAKDTRDDLETEIKKKREKGYRFDNIIFEDTRTGVLFQDGQEVIRRDLRQPEQVADLLTRFYGHEIEPFTKFNQAVAYFQNEIPHIAGGIKDKIEAAHKGNKKFQAAFETFMELCRASLNPNIAPAAVDEMLIQHMLTERLIRKVFNVEEFTRRNVIAGEVENVIDALTSQNFNRREFLGALDRFYSAIEEAADRLATFTEKQDFINHVYERFFQGYSVKVADTHGIVYTPQPIVDFMCAAVEEVLQNEFGKKLGDEGVYILDPATGTGNFIVNLIRRAAERNPRNLDAFYRHHLFANEVMLMPYYIASLNIEHEYYALTGKYEPFDGICFVDTLDMAEGPQMKLAFMTERNTARVERQKAAPITVIIGNPPYNVGQVNENDNNKNRKYDVIDKRVAETYAKDSSATNKNKIYDAYVRFFRWAVDRLQGQDGIVCYVSNNSFVDQIAFDGMRKHLLQDFTQIYHLDLHGNVRQNPKLSGTTHNVFGIQVGVGVTVAVRKKPSPLTPLPQGEGNKTGVWSSQGEGNEAGGWPSQGEGNKTEIWPSQGEGNKTEIWPSQGEGDKTEIWPSQGEGNTTKGSGEQDAVYRARASEAMTYIARDLRQRQTPAEKILWEALRDRRLDGLKFRRQHAIANTAYVADFLCYEAQLVVELDGSVHDTQVEDDAIRQSKIEEQGYRVLRFRNDDIFTDLESVLIQIITTARSNSPRPEGEGQGVRVQERAHLFYYRVPEFWTKREKLAWLDENVERLGRQNALNTVEWIELTPDSKNTWLVPENADEFTSFLLLGSIDTKATKSGNVEAIFKTFSNGIGTNRDTWAYDFSSTALTEKITRLVDTYNNEVDRWKRSGQPKEIDNFVTSDEKKIKWSSSLKESLTRGIYAEYKSDKIRQTLYRPFNKEYLFFDDILTHRQAGFPYFFPNPSSENCVIAITDRASEKPFMALISNTITDLHVVGAGASCQCFPFYTYDEDGSNRRENITDWALKQFQAHYGDESISKWDIFYYVYALLHHPGYRARYADNLKRELPRIPFVPPLPDAQAEGSGVRVFQAFSEAGKKLADLHLNYETVKPYELEWVAKNPISYRVEKMRLSKDKTAIQVNDTLTLKGIPPETFEYRLGNRSALDWVIDQYQVSTDKRSGITSDPNGYSDDERYIVNLVERVVRVSLETVQIVRGLEKLPFA